MPDPESFSWPAYLDKYTIREQTFAAAYAALSEVERSRIKNNICQLYSLAPANTREQITTATHWTSGFQSMTSTRPRDWCLLLLDSARCSLAGTVAAAVPALTSGIPEILTVFLGRVELSPRLLTGLELCGVPRACVLTRKTCKRLLDDLNRSLAQGLVLDLDNLFQGFRLTDSRQNSMTVWQNAPQDRIGVWSESPNQWDWQALSWNHSDVTIEIWGKALKTLPPGGKRMTGDWNAFLCQGYRTIGVPARLANDLPGFHGDLVLTPGQENCWYWPDLSPSLFLRLQTTLHSKACDLTHAHQ